MDWLLYWTVRAGTRLLSLLPLRTALALGRHVSALGFHVVGFRRNVVMANLRHVFGADRPGLRSLAAASYRQFGMNVVEVARGLHLPEEAAEWVTIPDLDALLSIQARNEPLILCCPHAGCFDRLGCAAALRGLDLHVMMAPVKSRRVSELLIASRERSGMHALLKGEESFYAMVDLLDNGRSVAILPDQNARRGVTVDFLGQPAMTFSAPAVLHLMTGARIAVVVDRRHRDDPRRHEGHVTVLPRPTLSGDRKRDIQEITQRICDAMSEAILVAPEQYFWLHRRWGKELTRAPRQLASPVRHDGMA